MGPRDGLALYGVEDGYCTTLERAQALRERGAYLELDANDYNCMAVITSRTYNGDGVMFEFTQSRHRPDYFSFQDNAIRKSPLVRSDF